MSTKSRNPSVELVRDDAYAGSENVGVDTNPLPKIGSVPQACFGEGDRPRELSAPWMSGEDYLPTHGSMLPQFGLADVTPLARGFGAPR